MKNLGVISRKLRGLQEVVKRLEAILAINPANNPANNPYFGACQMAPLWSGCWEPGVRVWSILKRNDHRNPANNPANNPHFGAKWLHWYLQT